MALCEISVQHADDGDNARCRNICSSLVHCVFLMYSPDGTKLTSMVQEVGSVRGQGRCWVVESCKITFLLGTSYSLVQTLFL